MAVRAAELIAGAISNVSRRKLRGALTVIAVFIGAFTLALTSGVGAGVRGYIDAQVKSMGASETLFVSSKNEKVATGDLATYDPNATSRGNQVLVTDTDLRIIRDADGVISAEFAPAVSPSYIQHGDGTRFVFTLGDSIPDMTFTLAAGDQLDYGAADRELVMPRSMLDDLGFHNAGAAVGADVTIGIQDVVGDTHDIDARVVGVIEQTLLADSPRGNAALMDALYDAQMTGAPAAERDAFPGIVAQAADIDVATRALTAEGYSVSSLADQLGDFQSVVDGIVLVLNIFAALALLTAAFGIVNVLLMSVQERTREIGILRALGMSRIQIFIQIALEAVWIAVLGAALAIGAAYAVGLVISGPLATELGLGSLAGLQLITITPEAVVIEVVIIVSIALIAAILPASRAAKLDPIEAIRHE